MMNEMETYCFERYKGYYLAVGQITMDLYGGIAYKHTVHNPEFVVKGSLGEDCLIKLQELIDENH